MADLTLKAGDTYPPFEAALSDGGTALNLTDASSVVVVMKGTNTETIITGDCTITDAASGSITYQWVDDDTDTADTYAVEFLITWSDGGLQTVPNAAGANPTVEIDERLDGATG